MKTLHAFTQFAVLVSLPLHRGGCGSETETVSETKPSEKLFHAIEANDWPISGQLSKGTYLETRLLHKRHYNARRLKNFHGEG